MQTTLRIGVLALMIAATTVGDAKESVSIQVFPAVSFAPADLNIGTTLEPDADNRALEIVADSDNFYRASAIPLEGDRAAKKTTVQFRGLPSGEYQITAAVIGANGRRKAIAHAQINVVASN